jgi:EAL domain-containing protein (putative c-di-GMP-specific phosphodiesterase class I)
VNISSHQLDRDLVDQVGAALARHAWPAHDLVLELTETSVIEDPEGAAEVLSALRARGLRIAIDDFGTGHSALSYLDQFPCDVLKIDRSFVEGLGSERQRTAIPTAIIGMAAALDLTTVAEGVEDEDQVNALLELGCSWAQGFHLGRPVWADEIGPVLTRS